MVGLYCEKLETRRRLRRALASSDCRVTDCRKTFEDILRGGASVAVVGLGRYSDEDIGWLRTLSAQGGPAGPAYLVVVPVSLEWVQWMRSPGDSEFQIVWAEEADERLTRVVARVDPWHQDPIRLLGRRLLANGVPNRSLAKVVERVCRTDVDDGSLLPVTSVAALAEHAGVNPRVLRRYWNTESPVQCTLKEFISWAVLLWALRERRLDSWDMVARSIGLRRRTLERYCARFLDCTLVVAGRGSTTGHATLPGMGGRGRYAAGHGTPGAGENRFSSPRGRPGRARARQGRRCRWYRGPAPPGFVLPRNDKQELTVFTQQRPRQLHPWRSLPMA